MSISALFAQEAPMAILEYFDDPDEIIVYDFTGEELDDVYFGEELLIGYGIQTLNSFAELRLEPNGSIIKMNPNTFIKLKELQGVAGTDRTRIAHTRGKIRVVAARVRGENYLFETPSMALGVRGTDFIIETDSDKGATVAVSEGIVDIFNPFDGSSVELSRGQMIETRNRVLSIIEEESAAVQAMIGEFDFQKLIPEDVPKFDFEEYRNEFEYFKDLDKRKYLEYFADDDFFDDFQEYMDKFKDYYRDEMEGFQDLIDEGRAAIEESIREAEENFRSGMRSFESFLNRERNRN